MDSSFWNSSFFLLTAGTILITDMLFVCLSSPDPALTFITSRMTERSLRYNAALSRRSSWFGFGSKKQTTTKDTLGLLCVHEYYCCKHGPGALTMWRTKYLAHNGSFKASYPSNISQTTRITSSSSSSDDLYRESGCDDAGWGVGADVLCL